ncbi:unnamed protein product [Thlaspi arvense]|uniref:Uncharacterized protein n=1 Tax=Thlaspi arvense TaxID=13288 RepID=A0AAU9RV45_THLAR|nr:unnamed protein product [Thlaspi arvense]
MDQFVKEINKMPLIEGISSIFERIKALQTELLSMRDVPVAKSIVEEAISTLRLLACEKHKLSDALVAHLGGGISLPPGFIREDPACQPAMVPMQGILMDMASHPLCDPMCHPTCIHTMYTAETLMNMANGPVHHPVDTDAMDPAEMLLNLSRMEFTHATDAAESLMKLANESDASSSEN